MGSKQNWRIVDESEFQWWPDNCKSDDHTP